MFPFPQINRWPEQIQSFFENVRNYLLSKKWIRQALRMRLFTMVPILILSIQLHFERQYGKRKNLEVVTITASNEFLRERVNGLSRKIDDFDIAIWEKLLKDGRFLIINVNQKYTDTFLSRIGLKEWDVIGHTDEEILPEEFKEYARIFHMEDSSVAANGRRLFSINQVPDGMGGLEPLLVIKWRRQDRDDIMIMGAAIRIKALEEQIKEIRFD